MGEAGRSILKGMKDFIKGFGGNDKTFGKSAEEALKDFYDNTVQNNNGKPKQKDPSTIGTKTNSSEFEMKYEPVFDITMDERSSQTTSVNKKSGFTLAADPKGDITVSVYRAEWDSTWLATTEGVRETAGVTNMDNTKYGSYVFSTEAGSSFRQHNTKQKNARASTTKALFSTMPPNGC